MICLKKKRKEKKEVPIFQIMLVSLSKKTKKANMILVRWFCHCCFPIFMKRAGAFNSKGSGLIIWRISIKGFDVAAGGSFVCRY